MPHHFNVFPDLTFLVVSSILLARMAWWIIHDPKFQSTPSRIALAAACLATFCVEVFGYLLGFERTWRHVPTFFATWMQAAGLVCSVFLIGTFLACVCWRSVPVYNPNRRQLLRAAGATLVAAPVVATGAGFISRNQFQLNEIEIKIPNLPRDLHGLRLVQISDIHLSPFLSEREFSHAIDMANETKAHIVLVTGDLITRTGDPLDACIRQLARLRTGSVRLGCMGNHEFYTGTERYVQEQCGRIGIDFLRSESTSLRFGDALINFAGVDYQHFHKPYLVGAQSLVAPGRFNVLLSHNPDVFPVAAGQGFDLTIAGHTHGGQVNFEILHQNLDIALAFTPYVRGLYWRGNSAAYVSSGIGTIGIPVRIGAPAEVSLITLCAS